MRDLELLYKEIEDYEQFKQSAVRKSATETTDITTPISTDELPVRAIRKRDSKFKTKYFRKVF